MQNRLITFVMLLLFSASFQICHAQNVNPHYNFRQLDVQNGLVQNIVYHFLQDSRGYLWIGTRNGITLYDGIRTINFQHDALNKNSLSANFITRILEDSAHRVWVGTDEGIDRFNAADNSFIHYTIATENETKKPTNCVLLGFTGQEDLWFIDLTSKSLKILDTKTAKCRFLTSMDAVEGTFYQDKITGNIQIWSCLGNSTEQLIFQHEKLTHRERFFDGDKKTAEPLLLIFHVYIENDSTAWLATAKGLIGLNPMTRNYKIYNQRNGEPVTELRYVAESPGGILWTGTGNAGIFTFDLRSKKFIDHFRNEALDLFSICSNNIVTLYFDKVGNVWCGSYGNGLSYAQVENNYFSKHLSKNEMDSWHKENNISWLGSDPMGTIWCMVQDVQGFWRMDSSLKLIAYHLPRGENGKPFIAAIYQLLFDGNTTAWCTTDRGLYKYNTVTNQIKQVEYPRLSASVFGSYWSKVIMRLHDSSILFSTFGGVYRIAHMKGKELILPLDAFKNSPVKAFDMMFEDSTHHLYIKDRADSLYILSALTADGDYKITKTLAFRPVVFQFQEYGSNIFMATDAGLYLLDKRNLTIEPSPLNKSLPFAGISNLLVENNNIWLFGEKGLYRYNEQDKTGRVFSVEDGLPSNVFKEYALYCNSGNCLAGTSNGILSFSPEKLKDRLYPPRAQLMNIYVNDSSRGFLANPQESSELVLEHDQNTFSFDYSCIGFQHAQTSSFEYKLDGFDENWIRGGTTNYTRYSKIAPGNYIFHLRVMDAEGKISPFAKTLHIVIQKAFWQTTLFKILMLVAFGFMIWLIVKWWLNMKIRKQQVEFEKLQAIEKERTRIATDMHDDLGAGLSRIKFLSETIGIKKQLQQPFEEDITSIGNYSSEMIGKMGEIVWALNEKNDSLSDLLSYTRAYASEYLLNNGIKCRVDAPSDFPAFFVSGEFRRNIYLTIKEALHNIVKHAEAENVVLTIKIHQNLLISIKDDGRGFDDLNRRPFSNGLTNMKKRMKDIGGTLEINQNSGTGIVLSVPL